MVCGGFGARLGRGALLLALAAVQPALATVVEELVQLPSAGDAKLPVLFSADDARPPQTLAVLFNGGAGAVGLLRRIRSQVAISWFVRARCSSPRAWPRR